MSTRTRWFSLALLGVVTTLALASWLVFGTRSSLTPLSVTDQARYWRDGGFALVTPAMRYPTLEDGGGKIEIWLKLPRDGELDVNERNGRASLIYPAGTVADRVESARYGTGSAGEPLWTVVDVRGTELTADDELYHTLRPVDAQPLAPLRGYAWSARDAKASAEAIEGLMAWLSTAPQPGLAEERRERFKRAFRGFHDCAACHPFDKPADVRYRRQAGPLSVLPPGATDGRGFYTPLAALSSTGPLRNHRPRDLNADDPFITVACPRGEPRLVADEVGGRRWECDAGTVPQGTLRIGEGLARGDVHAQAVCETRRMLAGRMTARAREAFSASLAECGIVGR